MALKKAFDVAAVDTSKREKKKDGIWVKLCLHELKCEKKQEKEEKRKYDSGKLSDGDQIDLMIIIWQTNVFVVNSSLFLFNYLLYEILVQLLIVLLENRLARVALSSSMYYIAISRY